MFLKTRAGLLLLALTLATTVTACTAPPTPASSVSATPTPSQTTLSQADQDLANAKGAVAKMWAVVDTLVNNPKSSSIQDLDAVAEGATLTMFQQNIMKYRAANWTGSGSSVVDDTTAALAGTNTQGQSSWKVTACIDSSATTLTDSNGKSVQGPPYRVRHQSTVVERAANFYVAEDTAVGTC
jgi:hypothetical protein